MTPRAVTFAVLGFAAGCAATREVPPSQGARFSGPAADAPLPLSLDAAREAHRMHEEKRHLRFLEAIRPGHLLRETGAAVPQSRIDAGEVSVAELRHAGRLLFEHEYTLAEGLGDARARAAAGRGESPFRRVHEARRGGPETTTCASCHWRGGQGGAGALVDASLVLGDGDLADGADPRNPPPLQGSGAVEALAAEMTRDLQAARARLVERAREEGRAVETRLVTKGVDFGVLRAGADGSVDAAGVDGVDPDLVVKPFGWKGTFATIRDFISESLQLHFGIQSEDLVREHARHPDPGLAGSGTDPEDPDGDGVTGELGSGQLTALTVFVATAELPVIRPPAALHGFEPAAKNLQAPVPTDFLETWARGRAVFEEAGCARCHRPVLVLESAVYRTRSSVTRGVLEIDLSRDGESPRLEHDPDLGGYPVYLFSDLKRHDLGPESASLHEDRGVAPREYLTRRLWGLASSSPYFYDGRAASLDAAIEAHAGDAIDSRSAFQALGREDQGALRIYLLSLTRERRIVVP